MQKKGNPAGAYLTGLDRSAANNLLDRAVEHCCNTRHAAWFQPRKRPPGLGADEQRAGAAIGQNRESLIDFRPGASIQKLNLSSETRGRALDVGQLKLREARFELLTMGTVVDPIPPRHSGWEICGRKHESGQEEGVQRDRTQVAATSPRVRV